MGITKSVKTPTAQLYDLPFIGDDLAKIGHAIDLFSQPCKPNAEVWVYALFHSVPYLLISVAKPEIIDINIRRHRGRKKRGRGLKLIPAAFFRDALIEVPVPRWVVFRVYEWTQRIGWYFLVADATEDFAINWMTMAYQWTGCDDPDPPPYLTAESGPQSNFTLEAEGWHSYIHFVVTDHHKADKAASPPNIEVQEGCIPRFTLNVSGVRPAPSSPGCMVTGWRVMMVGSSIPFAQGDAEGNPLDSSIALNSIPIGEVSPGTQFLVQYNKTFGRASLQSFRWELSSARSPMKTGFGPDP